MKKQASSRFLMWVMVMVISLHAHFSIAAVSKSNGTTYLCDGSIEDCFMVDSQLPTISSSHFRRILATDNNKFVALQTSDANSPAACGTKDYYHKCGAVADPGKDDRCAKSFYFRCPRL